MSRPAQILEGLSYTVRATMVALAAAAALAGCRATTPARQPPAAFQQTICTPEGAASADKWHAIAPVRDHTPGALARAVQWGARLYRGALEIAAFDPAGVPTTLFAARISQPEPRQPALVTITSRLRRRASATFRGGHVVSNTFKAAPEAAAALSVFVTDMRRASCSAVRATAAREPDLKRALAAAVGCGGLVALRPRGATAHSFSEACGSAVEPTGVVEAGSRRDAPRAHPGATRVNQVLPKGAGRE